MGTVFFDIDTQLDFLFPAGALYVPKAERLLPRVQELNRFAAQRGFPVISTTDAHAEDDPEFRQWPPHCIAGTVGQSKPCATLLDRRTVVPTGSSAINVEGAAQIIIEKQQLDAFTNPHLPEVLECLNASDYVVYGVVTEYCVRCAAFGLLDTGKPVSLVADAIETLKPEAGDRTIREFTARGGKVTTVAEVCSR